MAAILEVQVAHTLAELLHTFDRVAPRVMPVSHVQAEPDQVGIGALEQFARFGWCLDVTGAVVVKDGLEAELVVDAAGDAVYPFRHHIPFVRRERHARASPRLRHQFGHGPVVIRQDDIEGTHLGQHLAHLERERFAVLVGVGIDQLDRHKGREQL